MQDFAPGAKYIGSPFFSDRGGDSAEAIVLHIADGTLAGCDSWFNDPTAKVSAHFCIGKDGAVHQYIYLSNGAWANGIIEAGYTAALITENGYDNPNSWTISIEHEGNWPETPTAAQYAASVALTAWLFKNVLFTGHATGVKVDRKHILRHADISPLSRANCPGWPDALLNQYIADVQRAVDGTPAQKTYEQGLIDGHAEAIQAAMVALNNLK